MREMYETLSEEDVTFYMLSNMANSLAELFQSFQISEEEEKKYGKE